MKTLIGGAAAAVLGLIGVSVWFKEFLQLIAGALPIMLLMGGGLALYLGFDELKDSWKKMTLPIPLALTTIPISTNKRSTTSKLKFSPSKPPRNKPIFRRATCV